MQRLVNPTVVHGVIDAEVFTEEALRGQVDPKRTVS